MTWIATSVWSRVAPHGRIIPRTGTIRGQRYVTRWVSHNNDLTKTSQWGKNEKVKEKEEMNNMNNKNRSTDPRSSERKLHLFPRSRLVLCLRFVPRRFRAMLVGHLLQDVPADFAYLWITS